MIVLFGAGTIGRSVARSMKGRGVDVIFCDETPSKIGTVIDGVPVIGLQEGVEKHKDDRWIVTIVCVDTRPVIARLRYMGVNPTPYLDYVRTPEARDVIAFPFQCLEMPEVTFSQIDEALQAVSLFEDEHSRQVYLNQLRFRCGASAEILNPDYDSIPYLPDRFMGPDVTFVDGGAYDGDTIRSFREYPLKKIIAFEPDPNNFEKLMETGTHGKDIVVYENALSDNVKEIRFNSYGTTSSYADPKGETVVQGLPLDALKGRIHSPLYIKLDVEGSEMDAIEGMKGIITDLHPLLAVCVYHRNSDLWKIPLYLHEHYPFYTFGLIPHAAFYDLVLYAIPEGWKK
jgi:FkbM family methyltransferase